MTARPDWDDYFLGIASAVARRADCTRAQHGAVIVKDHRVVATGYNGSPRGGASCLAGECPRGLISKTDLLTNSADYSNCIALHAEQNAIAYANHSDTQGAMIYITGAPCDMCSKLIRAAGIDVVKFAPTPPWECRVCGVTTSVSHWVDDDDGVPIALCRQRSRENPG